jgi:DNA-binding response OmpR family regulator
LTPLKALMNPAEAITETKERQRILVVDNDLDMLRFLNHTLDQEGFDTVIVADSESALGVLDHLEPDMVIMDTITSDKASMRALDRMREHSNVPIVVLTSDNRLATLKDAFTHGADDFIHKPFGTKIFVARIRAKLRRYQRAIRP